MREYDHKRIEKKWQKSWAKARLYEVPNTSPGKENFYLLVEFPYPSGNLHVGHWYAFAVPDILARHLRMKGMNVLYPIGFDAFGLPAENAAIKNKINPREWTEQNMAHMREQIASMGTSFDRSREVVTCHPDYYRWTQWLFLQLLKAGLAYRKETAVNWCPKDKTVLANEQVVAGRCERCDSEVVQKQMLQWNLKITDYADRLIDDFAPLQWPEEIKDSQRNWIGRSEGAEIDFPLDIGKKYKYVILHGFKSTPLLPRWLWLKKELEAMGHEVIMPLLPNTLRPTEKNQVAKALKATTYDANTVLVGHSLGAVVGLKVLEQLKTPIARFVAVGGFIDPHFKDKERNFKARFNWKFDAAKIKANAPSITVLHDPRDHAITDAQAKALGDLLDVSVTLGTSNEPHFTGDTEPDVLTWLRPTIRVFTTRADTLFGATYLVLAPEHPWVKMALAQANVLTNALEIERYIALSEGKTELERQTGAKDKTGVELQGVKAINPATGEKISLYIADYVLGHYGTGAIMAVPAHDERDYAFAKKFDLPIKHVIEPLVVRTLGTDAFRVSEPAEERTAVMALVRHWSEDTYLCLNWNNSDVHGFVTGGIEKGEDAVATAKREIEEETGYSSAEFVKLLGERVHVKFYGPTKQVNRFAHFTPLVFKLKTGAQSRVDARDVELHEPIWIEGSKVSEYLNRDEFKLVWDRFQKEGPYLGDGLIVNSREFDGLTWEDAKIKMTERFGRAKKTYRLRDWIVSRQRYWGVPIPVVHCKSCGVVPVPESELPVLLPDVEDYLPTGDGKSPLAKVSSFVNVPCPTCGKKAERETDTFDTFVDSSWYFLRYADPNNDAAFAAQSAQDNWMPVDLYSGGAEHTTMHLLYSRFWHKALFDLGLVKDAEPYAKRLNRPIILGPDNQKMSKSRGNVIDPDAIVERLGADTVRMYLAFIGPYNEVGTYPWNPDAVAGVRRFIERVWRAQEYVRDEDVSDLDRILHVSIKKLGDDIVLLKFNTAIAQLMILLNEIEKQKKIGASQWLHFLKLLAPFAPHVAEELWSAKAESGSIHAEPWPVYEAARTVLKEHALVVQIDGKTRAHITIAVEANEQQVEMLAQSAVQERLQGATIQRVVIVPGRLVNFVTSR